MEIASMRTMLRAAGLVFALSMFGCDSGVTEGPVPFKKTDAKQFDEMKNQMIGNMKNKSYLKNKSAAPTTGAADAEKTEKTK